MLFVHETHQVAGREADRFEELYRDGMVAAFSPRFGSGARREIVLWQRIAQPQGLLPLFNREVPAPYRAPGTWMHDALEVRDQWESRLLRVAEWSPLA